MAFWSGEKILENKSVVSNFEDANVDANAYNLRMGRSYFRTADRDGKEPQKKTQLSAGESFLIPSGQFAFLVTKETVHIPSSAMAFISMRTGLKFQGLVNVSGFHVDPGYSGHLIYAVYNASPSQIQICEGDKLFKIWFADLDRPTADEHAFVGNPVNDITNEMVRGMSQEIYSLQALAEKIRNVEKTLENKLAEQKTTVDALHFVWRAVIIGVVVAAISALFVVAWGLGRLAFNTLAYLLAIT